MNGINFVTLLQVSSSVAFLGWILFSQIVSLHCVVSCRGFDLESASHPSLRSAEGAPSTPLSIGSIIVLRR